MSLRALTAGLVVCAAAADAAVVPGIAFYALLVAVPASAAAGLVLYGDLLEDTGRATRLQGVLWLFILALVVIGAAARSPAVAESSIPVAGTTALAACLAALCAETFLATFAELRRRTAPAHG